MTYWRRHPKPLGQEALVKIDGLGWLVENPRKGGTYYTVKCPCKMHQRRIHASPSDPNHYYNAVKWVQRQSCSRKGGGESDRQAT